MTEAVQGLELIPGQTLCLNGCQASMLSQQFTTGKSTFDFDSVTELGASIVLVLSLKFDSMSEVILIGKLSIARNVTNCSVSFEIIVDLSSAKRKS